MKGPKKEFRKVVGGKQAVAETPQADGRPADGGQGLFRKHGEVGEGEGDKPADGNLDADGVLAGAVEFGDVEAGFQEAEEDFDPPAFAVHFSDFGCCPVEQIGDDGDGPFVPIERR